MRKYILFFIFVVGIFMLTACNTTTPISDSSSNSVEVGSSSTEPTLNQSNANSSSAIGYSSTYSTSAVSNTDNSSEKDNTNSTSDEESKDKIKDDGELNDGIEWGPLED